MGYCLYCSIPVDSYAETPRQSEVSSRICAAAAAANSAIRAFVITAQEMTTIGFSFARTCFSAIFFLKRTINSGRNLFTRQGYKMLFFVTRMYYKKNRSHAETPRSQISSFSIRPFKGYRWKAGPQRLRPIERPDRRVGSGSTKSWQHLRLPGCFSLAVYRNGAVQAISRVLSLFWKLTTLLEDLGEFPLKISVVSDVILISRVVVSLKLNI